MSITVTHTFVSTKLDGADSSVVKPSDWNASHLVTGTADVGVYNVTMTANTTVSYAAPSTNG